MTPRDPTYAFERTRPLKKRLVPRGDRLTRSGAALALLAFVGLGGGCGYHLSASARLPGGARALTLLAPDVTATGRPLLAASLTSALARALGRRGIARVEEPTAPRLHVVVHHLTLDDVAVVAGQTKAEGWVLQVEAQLVQGHRTLWRSGILTLRGHAPVEGESGRSESSRRRTWDRLAGRVATRLVTGLLAARGDGRAPRSRALR